MGNHKRIAVDFLEMVTAGNIEKAYEHVDMKGRHHNPYTPAGMPALKKGMQDNDAMFPLKRFNIKHVLEDGNMVSVHSHLILKPGELELSVVHLLQFEGNKIVEFWDCATQVPKEAVNQDGMF
jgi:predicted SnoaL-like aldol condensation-catalyzing enzyme